MVAPLLFSSSHVSSLLLRATHTREDDNDYDRLLERDNRAAFCAALARLG